MVCGAARRVGYERCATRRLEIHAGMPHSTLRGKWRGVFVLQHRLSRWGATAATTSRLASAMALALASSPIPTPRTPLALLDGPLVSSPPHACLPAEQEEDNPASRQRILLLEPMQGNKACYNKLRGATRFLGASTLLVLPMTLVHTHPKPLSVPWQWRRRGR